MHRSQALSGAFTMRERGGAAARNGAVSEQLDAASSSSFHVTVLGAGRLDQAATIAEGMDRIEPCAARGGAAHG